MQYSFDVILVGTHEYEWAVNIFARLYEKYWPDGPRVHYIGDRVEGFLAPNVHFMQVPCYSEGVWDWEHWFGAGLQAICDWLGDRLFLLFLPDHWLYQPVSAIYIEMLALYMKDHSEIVRGGVTAKAPIYDYGTVEYQEHSIDILTASSCDQHVSLEGGLTFYPSLWNPRLLRELIEPGWTLQRCESLGTARMCEERKELRSVSISPAPIYRAHTLRHAQSKRVFLQDVSPPDRLLVRHYIPNGWEIIE